MSAATVGIAVGVVLLSAVPASAGKPGSTATLTSKVCKQLGGAWSAAPGGGACTIGTATPKTSLSIPSGVQLNVGTSLTVKSGLTITNNGMIFASLSPPSLPSITVSGRINNLATMDIGPLTVNSGGTVTNGSSGTTYFEDGATAPGNGSVSTVKAGGTFDNLGLTQVYGTIHNFGQLLNEVDAEIDNQNNTYTSTILNEVGGTFTNNGTLSSFHVIENAGNMSSEGTFTNQPDGGSFSNDPGAEFDSFSGTFTNDGSIANAGTVQLNGMTFSNTGVFTTSSSLIVNTVGFTNTGTITNTSGDASTFGVSVFNSVIDNKATVDNQGGWYLYLDGTFTNESGATVTNSGTVTNDGTVNNSGTWTNTGSGACVNGAGTGCPA